MPEIIQFSNALCYRNTLVPLRQCPPNRLRPVLKMHHISDGYRTGDSRSPQNIPEAEAIVVAIEKCCGDPAYKGKTMGVISLLAEGQAKLIEKSVLNRIGAEEIERRRLVFGDAYAFQGDERDIIFLSLVAAPGETSMSALTGQKHLRRFNVAASRARDQLWLFHTPTVNDFRNHEDLRFKLVSFFYSPAEQLERFAGINPELLKRELRAAEKSRHSPPPPFGSWFEVDVFLQICGKGYRVIPQFETAGYFIDMVIEGQNRRLAVECDGDKWHGLDRYESDMTRQRMLERCGQVFWRVRGSEYYGNPEQSLHSLWSLLEDLEIYPIGEEHPRTDSIREEEPLHESSDSWKNGGKLNEASPTDLAPLNRQEMLEAILRVLPGQNRVLRSDVIKSAARLLRDEGRIEYQRLREDGQVWVEFKSAIHSGIRRGIVNGDAHYIWRS